MRALEALGAQVWSIAARHREVAWLPLLRKLAASGIVSVMIEGGAAVAASALKDKIVDKIIFFYAPKIIGGDGRAMIGSVEHQARAKLYPVKKNSGREIRR